MASADLIASTFADVQHVLQLGMLACDQHVDRTLAAFVGAIVALVGADPQRDQLLERIEQSIALARRNYTRRPRPVVS